MVIVEDCIKLITAKIWHYGSGRGRQIHYTTAIPYDPKIISGGELAQRARPCAADDDCGLV